MQGAGLGKVCEFGHGEKSVVSLYGLEGTGGLSFVPQKGFSSQIPHWEPLIEARTQGETVPICLALRGDVPGPCCLPPK